LNAPSKSRELPKYFNLRNTRVSQKKTKYSLFLLMEML
jgi:hypothetical protein